MANLGTIGDLVLSPLSLPMGGLRGTEEFYFTYEARVGSEKEFSLIFADTRVSLYGLGLPYLGTIVSDLALGPGLLQTAELVESLCVIVGESDPEAFADVEVTILLAGSKQVVERAVPDSLGTWSAKVPPGNYFVLYTGPGFNPVCHGPYSVS